VQESDGRKDHLCFGFIHHSKFFIMKKSRKNFTPGDRAVLGLDQTGFSGSPGATRQAVLTVEDTSGNSDSCTATITFK